MRDETKRLAEHTFAICPMFDASRLAVLGNEDRSEAPVLPLEKSRQMEKLRSVSALLAAQWETWKGAAKGHILVKTLLPTGTKVPSFSVGTGPQAPRIENQPHKACLFPL